MRSRRVFLLSVFLLAISMVFSLTACSGNKVAVRASVSADLDAIKYSDPFALGMFNEELEIAELYGIQPEELASVWFDGFSYSIDEVKVDGNFAFVKVTVTSKRLDNALDKSNPALTEFMAGVSDSDEAYARLAQCGPIVLDNLQAEPLHTDSLTLDYRLENGLWVITETSRKSLALALGAVYAGRLL